MKSTMCAPPDNLPPNLSGALHTIFEENLPDPDVNPPEETVTASYLNDPSIIDELYIGHSLCWSRLKIE